MKKEEKRFDYDHLPLSKADQEKLYWIGKEKENKICGQTCGCIDNSQCAHSSPSPNVVENKQNKPCPMCNGKIEAHKNIRHFYNTKHYTETDYYIGCQDCEVFLGIDNTDQQTGDRYCEFKTAEEAELAWNKLPYTTPTAVDELDLEAKQYLKNRGLKNPPIDSGASGGGDAPRVSVSDIMDKYAQTKQSKVVELIEAMELPSYVNPQYEQGYERFKTDLLTKLKQ